jgi:hypothetical protein
MLKGLAVLVLAVVSFFLYSKFGAKDGTQTKTVTQVVNESEKADESIKKTPTKIEKEPTIAQEVKKVKEPKVKVQESVKVKVVSKKPTKSITYYDKESHKVKKVDKIPKNSFVIKLPEVPKVEAIVPTVVTVGGNSIMPRSDKKDRYNRSISTPVSAPPKKEIKALIAKAKEHHDGVAKVEPKEVVESTDKKEKSAVVATSTAGNSSHGRVPTYLRTTLMDEKDVIKKLKDAGFSILATIKVDDNPNLISIVFSNDELLKYADKKDRGFVSTLRVLIDKEHKQTTISNPLYFAKAFMQDDYSSDVPASILKKLQTIFPNSKSSKDLLKDSLLPKYHFMMGMPYFEDMEDVAKASSSEVLLKKIQAYKGGSRLIYTHKLSKDRIVVGVIFSKKTNGFIKKIGTQNALLMPYPILLEGGVAKMLNPKYYLAVSYPMLKMSQFMAIATVPDDMIDECEVMFK